MAKQTPDAVVDTKKSNSMWTLLVQAVIDYKAFQSVDGNDWETIKNKYKEITEKFQSRYPKRENGVE